MIVVSDTTPFIALAKIERLSVLPALFKIVRIPDAVYREIVDGNLTGADEMRAAPWLRVEPLQDPIKATVLSMTLDYGEACAIALALELGADLFLADDRRARRSAAMLGLRVKGTIGLLIAAYRIGLITDLCFELDRLKQVGIWIDESLYKRVLTVVEEK